MKSFVLSHVDVDVRPAKYSFGKVRHPNEDLDTLIIDHKHSTIYETKTLFELAFFHLLPMM